jgi:hypothetical protein
VSKLNPDVFAGAVLRRAYREQMDIHATKAREAETLRAELERVEADRRTAADCATSLMETLNRYGGMLPPDGDAQP